MKLLGKAYALLYSDAPKDELEKRIKQSHASIGGSKDLQLFLGDIDYLYVND